MSNKLKEVPISEIRENPVALRTVNKQHESYQGLMDSIKAVGVLKSITVREKKGEDGVKFYELIDGLHRFSAARDVGLATIPAQIMDASDAQVLELQIIGNIHVVETRPCDYTAQLRRMLNLNPLMTESELASKLGKSPKWIEDRLSLGKIADENIKTLINEDKITLTNAYALAKLPPEEVKDYVQWAMTESPDVFLPRVQNRVKEIRDARVKGSATAITVFEPVAHLRKLPEIRESVNDDGRIAAIATGATDIKSAVQATLKWVIHLDDAAVAEQKSKFDAMQAEAAEKRAKRDAEMASKKVAKAERLAKEAANAAAELEGKPLPHPELVDQK